MSGTPNLPSLGGPQRLAPAKRDPIFGGRPKEELEFLPAALEVVETPAPPLPRVTALALVALLLTTLLWACLGKVDVVSAAAGKLIPAGGGKVVQPLETGTVTAIRVHDGEHVHAGQLLVALEPTEATADRDRLQDEVAGADLDVARLKATALGQSFTTPGGVNTSEAAVGRQQAAAARTELAEKLATLDRQIQQHRAEIGEAQAEVNRLAALLPIDEQAADVFVNLERKGYGSRLQLLQAQEKAEDTRRQLDVQRQKVPELQAQIAAEQQQRAETSAETANGELGDLSTATVKAASLRQQFGAAQAHLKTRTLLAPVDGTVQELAIHTVGGVVEPGQTLMRIAPSGVGVEVEAKLANRDVGFVRAGMPAVVKVETFPFTRYGVIPGVVSDVSEDAVSDKRPDGSEELSYLMHVRLSRDTMSIDGRLVRLEPGMAVGAEVKTAKRRVIAYVLSPIAKSVQEAGRER
ncbi:HlyD family type I secretion periplasmic adaptor subunit [Caulobacter sp. S45]|uniref:HlyD family type I secretion periplasmic adaptor subunit n=1 Tax=Caulobacter sp. S45 TaxID=1641861 RepID=UPI0015771DD9|nr:HlyD family type I secretion periplasmic adaptor subunit [Caulobacter sp. S45]